MFYSLADFVKQALPKGTAGADVDVVVRTYINYCALTGAQLPADFESFQSDILGFIDIAKKTSEIKALPVFVAAGFSERDDLREFLNNTKIITLARRRAFFERIYPDYLAMVKKTNPMIDDMHQQVQEVAVALSETGAAAAVPAVSSVALSGAGSDSEVAAIPALVNVVAALVEVADSSPTTVSDSAGSGSDSEGGAGGGRAAAGAGDVAVVAPFATAFAGETEGVADVRSSSEVVAKSRAELLHEGLLKYSDFYYALAQAKADPSLVKTPTVGLITDLQSFIAMVVSFAGREEMQLAVIKNILGFIENQQCSDAFTVVPKIELFFSSILKKYNQSFGLNQKEQSVLHIWFKGLIGASDSVKSNSQLELLDLIVGHAPAPIKVDRSSVVERSLDPDLLVRLGAVIVMAEAGASASAAPGK